MVIASFNVNSVRVRTGIIGEWLEKRGGDIDVLCLQELKTVNEGFPVGEFEKLGFKHFAVSGQKAYNGVAVCSRYPIADVKEGFGDSEKDTQKRLITVNIKGCSISNIYAPHGDDRGSDKFMYKLNWYKWLEGFIAASGLAAMDSLLVGDFNVAIEDIDVYDPVALKDTVAVMPEERDAFRSIQARGFIDLYRHFYPDKVHYTWWPYGGGGAFWKNKGMRIDYALAGNDTLKIIKSVEIDIWPRKKKQPSDHAPLIVTTDH